MTEVGENNLKSIAIGTTSRGGTDKNFEKQNSQKIKFEAGVS
jgi:hypothetical protein